MVDEDLENGIEDSEIVDAIGVGGRVIGHEEPEKSEDKVLQAEG